MALFFSKRLRVSKETTCVTGPLKSDGKQVDYFMAIRQETRPENAATDGNGFRLIVRHMGMDADTEPEYAAKLCEELGLDAETLRPDMTCADPYDLLKAYVESGRCDDALLRGLKREGSSSEDVASAFAGRLDRPWTLDELPMLASWLDASGPALDLIGRSVRKPVFHIPLARRSEHDDLIENISLWELCHLRAFARGLKARANYRLAASDIDGAIDDVMACKRLGRHAGRRVFAIDLLVGMGVEALADATGIAASLEHRPTKQQLERFIHELGRVPPRRDILDIMRFERLFALDGIQMLALGKGSWNEDGLVDHSKARYVSALGVDWNLVTRRFNRLFDEMVATDCKAPGISLSPFGVASLVFRRARSHYVADVLLNSSFPVYRSIMDLGRRGECAERMQRITLAMLLYELDHGTLPPAWSADADGKPLHSWRVLLLPYLGQEELYARIRLDEPWDSEHNRKFHGEAVEVYCCPSDPDASPGETTYSVVVGPDMPFEAGVGKRLADFGLHSDDMILLAERTDPVGWMDPTGEITQAAADEGIHDRSFASEPSGPGRIGSHHPNRANFGFRNGALRALSSEEDGFDAFDSKEERHERFKRLLRGTNMVKTTDY